MEISPLADAFRNKLLELIIATKSVDHVLECDGMRATLCELKGMQFTPEQDALMYPCTMNPFIVAMRLGALCSKAYYISSAHGLQAISYATSALQSYLAGIHGLSAGDACAHTSEHYEVSEDGLKIIYRCKIVLPENTVCTMAVFDLQKPVFN